MGNIVPGAWIAVWVAISVSMIVTNKYILGYAAFEFPFTLALWHMVLAGSSAWAAIKALAIPDTIRQHSSSKLHVQMVAIGGLFGASLVLGNWTFMYLTVPTIQMLKAVGPASFYIAGVCLGMDRLQAGRAINVLVVCVGVAIASYEDVTINVIGMALQMGSICTDALRCCFLQKVLQHNQVEAPALVVLAYMAPYSAAVLVLPTVFFEGPKLAATYNSWQPALPFVVLSGVLATCINFVVLKLIQLTSALTTSLAGVFKQLLSILMAMYVYPTPVTATQWLGYSIAIAGLIWYDHARRKPRADGRQGSAATCRATSGSITEAICLGETNAEAGDMTAAREAMRLDACERNMKVAALNKV